MSSLQMAEWWWCGIGCNIGLTSARGTENNMEVLVMTDKEKIKAWLDEVTSLMQNHAERDDVNEQKLGDFLRRHSKTDIQFKNA